jgi:hypothetical protein
MASSPGSPIAKSESELQANLMSGGIIFMRQGGGDRPFFHKTSYETCEADGDDLIGGILTCPHWSTDRSIRVDYHSFHFPDTPPGEIQTVRYFAQTESGKFP